MPRRHAGTALKSLGSTSVAFVVCGIKDLLSIVQDAAIVSIIHAKKRTIVPSATCAILSRAEITDALFLTNVRLVDNR